MCHLYYQCYDAGFFKNEPLQIGTYLCIITSINLTNAEKKIECTFNQGEKKHIHQMKKSVDEIANY